MGRSFAFESLGRTRVALSRRPEIIAWLLGLLTVVCLVGCERPSTPTPTAENSETTASTTAALCADAGPPPSIGAFAVYATESVELNGGSLVTGCAVGVENANGPFINGGVAAYLNSSASIQSTQTLYADSVYVNSGAKLGPIDTNHLTDKGSTHGTVSPLPSPMPAAPTMPAAKAGTSSINLNSGTQTLAPGAYGSVLVGAGATLKLSGGNYVFSSLTLNSNASLTESATTTLSVTGSATIGSGSFTGPASGSGLTARNLTLYFQSSQTLNLNSNAEIHALLVATNALVTVDTGKFYGAIAAAQVRLDSGGTVTCQDGFGAASCPSSCDDGNACTTDSCSSGACVHTAVANGTSCSDGNACTQTDSCQSGTCTGSNPVTCAAADQCHVAGTCNTTTGQCSNPTAANGTSCSDGNACTQSDSCQSGTCTGSNPVTCAAADQCHLAGTCNTTTGQCSSPTAANGTSCSDGNACTQSDSCQSGTCTGSNPVTCVAADQCHVAGTCNATTGACTTPAAANGTACSDGNACTQTDSCQSGACMGANPVTCAAADQCHVAGACNAATGQCSNPAAANGTSCNDGNACTRSDSCQSGACAGANPVSCTASDQCHVAGTCDTGTGQCSNPTAANGTSCSDGNACTQTDACQSGACTGSNPVSCTAADQCHVAGTCNTSTGACTNPAAANGTSCSDGNACTQTDSCQSGACTGSNPVTCAAADQCHVAGTCDTGTGQCSNPSAANGTSCSDGNACTQTDACQSGACTGSNPVTCTASDQCHVAGSCNTATGACTNPAAANGTSCSDGNACTQTDACQSGACTGSNPVTCSASDQCHAPGTCDTGTGQCSNPNAANGTSCSDGNACTQTDACQSGACTGSNPVTCSASDQCHVAGTCDTGTGQCSNPNAANGTSCSDGNACTQTDACQSGACTGSNPVTCAASDQCHQAGACDPNSGACSNPTVADGTSCTDGNACTRTDACLNGACTGSNPVACAASDQCHLVGTCDTGTGQCSNPAAANGATCSDGNACTQTDSCQSGTCTGSNPVACSPADACHTAGTCDATSGTCSNPLKPTCPPGLPPDPATVAPPLDTTTVTTVYEQTQFLYAGSIPVQTGVASGTIVPTRACELFGTVLQQSGEPEPGMVITVVNHPEFGQTMSRADGRFNLVVNGGEAVTIDYAGTGYLPVQRTVTCPWQNYAHVPTIVVVPYDPNVTTVNASSSSYQVAKGSVETDKDGTRQGVLLIPPGTTISTLSTCGGTPTPLSSISVRITEYTVGPSGARQMPASLPSTSAYTYAFDTSADEAVAAGTSVQFSQPVVYYNDNFLGFPAGTGIPLGSYGRSGTSEACTTGTCGGWAPQTTGIVFAIVSITGGTANLDVTGDGVADSTTVLATYGITAAEQQQLAQLYAAGKSLWRVQLPHFSAWDSNWGFAPPIDAIAPNAGLPTQDVLARCQTGVEGAPVDPLSQSVVKNVPVVGTPYSLVYDSQRTDDHTAARDVLIPLTGPTVPADVTGVTLEVTAGGNTFSTTFPPTPDQSYTYVWNGQDAFGRELQGAQPVTVTVGFTYAGVYAPADFNDTPRFGHYGTGTYIVAVPTRMEVTLPKVFALNPPAFDEKPVGLGGWNLDVHHSYDTSGDLYLGDGTTRAGVQLPTIITNYDLPGKAKPTTGANIANVSFCTPGATAVASDGSLYVVDWGCPAIWHISTTGTLTLVAGTGTGGYSGDEGPATAAQINPYLIGRIALARECDRGFYFTDYKNSRVRHVDAQGIIHTVVGSGVSRNVFNQTPPGGQAVNYVLGPPSGIAVAADGGLYVTEQNVCDGNGYHGARITHVDTDGITSFTAGCGTSWLDNVPALSAQIFNAGGLAVGNDGTLYYTDSENSAGEHSRVRAISSDGLVSTVAGASPASVNSPLPAAAGVPVALADLATIGDVAVDASGVVYFSISGFAVNSAIYSVVPGGTTLHLFAGGGSSGNATTSAGGPAANVFMGVTNFTLGTDGTVYETETTLVRKISPVSLPGLGPSQFSVPSVDGREAYIFDANGRHLRTVDALTGAVRYSFAYDSAGRLSSVTDLAGNVTTVQHDASGLPLGITGPYGQKTSFLTDSNGYLSSITDPAGATTALTSTSGGLLTAWVGPAGDSTGFAYDPQGRLSQVATAAGGTLAYATADTYTSAASTETHSVTQTTALGVVSSWSVATTADAETRTSTLPSGRTASQSVGPSGSSTTTLADGVKTTISESADPRFGVVAPVLSSLTSASPAGLSFVQTQSRTVALTDPTNFLSLTSLTDTTTVDPTAKIVYTTAYTAASRTFAMTTGASRSRKVTLDSSGRLSSSQRDSLNADLFTYDAHGRLSTIAQGARTRTYAYDANGMLSTVIDPATHVTTFVRDGAGRVTTETLADTSVAGFAYDGDGHVASMVTPSGVTHAFAHTTDGQLASYVAPAVSGVSATTTSYDYDADGRLTQFVRPTGADVTFAYDRAGRTSSVSLPTGQIAVAYDPTTGRPATATGPAGEQVAYVYDGSLTTQMNWSGPVAGQVSWTYDKSMKPIAEAVDGSAVSFAYDADGLMTRAGKMTLVPSATTGLLTSTALGNVTDALTYDQFAERATYAAKYGTTALFATSYTRDALGRILTKAETVQGTTHNFGYTYDARGRLTDVTQDGAAKAHYVYDTNGNRTSSTVGGVTTTATYDAQDRLLTYGTLSYTYDADGALASKTDSATGAETRYTYDALGNLSSVVLPGGSVLAYVLDAAGRRVAKTINGETRREWLYRDSLRPVAELDESGAVTTRFVYADGTIADKSVPESVRERLGLSRATPLSALDVGRPMYLVRGTQTLRVIADHLGTPRMLVDVGTGAVVQSLTYDDWGNVSGASGNDLPTLGFVGGILDPDTGLVHFGARDYDPQTGRWTAKEPMKTSGTLNFYQYAAGDPVNAFDNDGLARVACPDAQTVLDSICGPNAEGEVKCVQHSAGPTGEAAVAQGGAATTVESDTTTWSSPSDLPTVQGDGTASTSEGWVDIGASSAAANVAPVVSVGSSNTLQVAMPAKNVALSGTVTDSGPYTPQVLWTWTSGPAAPVFANPASAATTVTFPQIGVYTLVLMATDLELQSSATLTVTVVGAPLVQVAGPGVVDLFDAQNPPTAPVYHGQIVEPLAGHTVTTAWSAVSGPGTVTFGTPTSTITAGGTTVLSTTAQFSASGTYVLQLTGTDGTYSSSATLSVVIGTDEPPVVGVSGDQTLPSPSETVVAGVAVGYLDSLPISYTWSQVSGPVPVVFDRPGEDTTDVYLSYPGVYVIQLTASDTELSASKTLTITVNGTAQQPPQGPDGPAPKGPPTLGGITDDGVVTQPTQITGTFDNALWTLSYRLGGRDDVTTSFTTLATGTGAMNNGVLGTFDPTLLLNGLYTVQLTVSTQGGSATSTVAVSVDGRMKVGNFTLAFTDLDVPVGGLPLDLIRTYDSRDKRIGDFGYGWNLSVRDVRVEKSGKIGAYWQTLDESPDDSFFPEYCLQPSQSATVTVTFPSGREYRFTPSPQCTWLLPPDPSDIYWTCTSDPGNTTIQLKANGSQSLQVSGGQLLNLSDNEPWDPRQFTFTNELGVSYAIDQDKGVTQLTDRHGDTVSITAGGIFSSLGPSIPFTRDEQGRITTITDPKGAAMEYAYNDDGDLATYTDRASYVTSFAYAANHYLDEIQDPLGRTPIRCDYDDSGRLLDETDTNGHQVTFATNLAANQQVITDRLGRATQYTYNLNGDVTQKIDPAGGTWSYSVDARGNILTSTDPLGRVTTSTYDTANNLLTRLDPMGQLTVYTYNAWRQNLKTVDPLGHVTTNVYDGTGNLTTTTDGLGNTTSYGYDQAGNRTLMVDPLGQTTKYTYDGAGHMLTQTDPLTRVTTFTYDANANKLTLTQTRTNSAGKTDSLVTAYTYDTLNRITKTTYPDASYRATTFTATGKTATTVDELTRTTRYTYDDFDRLVTTTRPDGSTIGQTYDAENERTSSTDAAGATTGYQYDGAGRLTVTTHPDATTAITTYDLAGQTTATTDEAGYSSQTAYDADGRLVRQTDPLGNATSYTYDAAGNQLTVSDALGRTTRTAYDADNRSIATSYPDGTADSVSYDAAGRMIGKTDTLGRASTFGYDADGRLTSVTDPLKQVTTYAYDEIGERVSQTDANAHVTSFAYDLRGRQTQRKLPDASTETMTYDLAGEKTARLDFNGMTTAYAYDALSRLTSRSYATDATQNIGFTYTTTGQRATETDTRGTTVYVYDARQRLTSMTYPNGNKLTYAYDARSLRTGITTAIGNQSLTTTTAYDADGRPSTVQDPLGRAYNVAYDSVGERTSLTLPNSTRTTYGYDLNGRLLNLATAQTPSGGGSPLSVQSFTYTLDAAGKRTAVAEADGTARHYGYDGIDRLTGEAVTGSIAYAKTFTYDPVGNRLTQTTTGTGAASVAYTYDTRDRMLTAGGATYAYDANGNATIETGAIGYTYDLENRLTAAEVPGSLVSYGYDADGNRVQSSTTPQSGAAGLACSGTGASFLRQDATTQGTWQGTYGADGSAIPYETQQNPSYGALSISGDTTYEWVNGTTDARALQQPTPQTSRIASAYYSTTSETFHVSTTDGKAHTVAFYLLDYDRSGRAMTMTAQTTSGTVLDASRAFPAYANGIYAVYTVCGSVDFVATKTAGPNATVAGVFFGTAGAPTTTSYVVDTNGGLSQAAAETDANNALTAYYIRNGDELMAVMRPGGSAGMWTTRFVHADGLGSVRTLTDESGDVVDTRGYEAFGTKNVEAGSDPLAYGFAGEPLDGTTKLAYHRARWMDSRVGRFVGMDPFAGYISVPDSLHRYQYASNSPTFKTDPTGLQDDIEDVSVSVEISGIEASAEEVVVAHPAAIAAEVGSAQEAAVVEEALAEAVGEGTSGIGEATAQRVVTQQGLLRTSATVARQLAGKRAFIPVQAILAAIASGTRTADPQGVANAFMYTAEAVYNGSERILEVLVDEESGTILHVLYK